MRRAILLLAVMALAVFMAAPSALAKGPTTERIPYDVTGVFEDLCAFRVDYQMTGVEIDKSWDYADGSWRFLQTFAQARATLTSAEHTIVLNNGGPFRALDLPSVSYTDEGTGNYLFVTNPDTHVEPGLFYASGHWIYTFDYVSEDETWTFHGRYVDLCPLLA